MNTSKSCALAFLLIAFLPAFGTVVRAQPVSGTATADASSAAASAPDDAQEPRDSQQGDWEYGDRHERFGHRRHDNNLINLGGDSHLPRGQRAGSVVSIMGSSSSEGAAREVVSILGNTRVTGPVGRSAVAVLGNTYVDSAVDGDVIAVLGNVELGPNAVVGGNVVGVGGTVQRDPSSIIRGSVQSIGARAAGFGWLRPWIDHCLLYGRPLALVPGIEWAWGLAIAFLVLYAGLALLFGEGITRCVHTLETQPGMTVLAAILTALLIPVLLVLLCITLVGIAAVPFVVGAIFGAGLFGKAVMLAWLGRRCLGGHTTGTLGHPALAVLIGGVIVLVLYLVPVLGFIVYKLLGLFGLGAVLYTLILAARAWQAARPGAAPASVASGPAAAAASASTAGAVPPAGTVPPAGAVPPAGGAPPAGAAPRASAGATSSAISAALPRAGFWIRMVALLLDALLVGFLMGVLHHVFHLELLVLAAYGAVMWKLRGSTIGGIVFDLQVVRLDGRPIDWETAIVRALSCFLSLAVAGLGFFWIAFDHGKQAWHDKIAGTAVIRVAKSASLV